VANYYLDTSALVKRYVASEAGSAWVQSLCAPSAGNLLLTSQIVLVEVAAAFARKEREGEIRPVERTTYLGLFVQDCQHYYHLLALTDILLRRAADLTHRLALRAYDAIHLATAVQANTLIVNSGASALTFVSADARLCAAGQAEGLSVDNPADHP
jgi:predicted nucleic acid-binding protein